MVELRQRRCFHHPNREAAALCPSCQRHFCRECVTLLAGKMTCASCQDDFVRERSQTQANWSAVIECISIICAVVFLWGAFAGLGKVMASIPDTVHDASYWEGLSEGP